MGSLSDIDNLSHPPSSGTDQSRTCPALVQRTGPGRTGPTRVTLASNPRPLEVDRVEAWLSLCSTNGNDRASDSEAGGRPNSSVSEGRDPTVAVGGDLRSAATDVTASTQPQPLGVFWDIENCQVPRRCTATAFVELVRLQFLTDCWEAEFMCACDVGKTSQSTLHQLNDAQVNVLHVPATSKNAADEKIKQSLRRFSDQFPAPASVLLITGDVNFAPDLAFLKHRKKLRVYLIHNKHARATLLSYADRSFLLDDFVPSAADGGKQQESLVRGGDRLCCHLRVTELPPISMVGRYRVVSELQLLISNCGGRLERLDERLREAVLVFPSPDNAARAKYRLHHAVICGHQTFVQFHFEKNSCRRALLTDNAIHTRTTVASRRPLEMSDDNSGGDGGWSGGPRADLNAIYSDGDATAICGDDSHRSASGADSQPATTASNNSEVSTQTSVSSIVSDDECDETMKAAERTPRKSLNLATRDSATSPLPPASPSNDKLRPAAPPNNLPRVELHRTLVGGVSFPPPPIHLPPPLPGGLVPPMPPPPPVGLLYGASRSVDSVECTEAPIELTISNLDPSKSPKELETTLLEMASPYAKVLSLSVANMADGALAAAILVSSRHDAQALVAHLHRVTIGTRRITLAYSRHSGANTARAEPQKVQSQIISLLGDVPARRLALVSFMEIYEQRYHSTVPVSDLFRMRDTVCVTDSPNGRIVQLHHRIQRHLDSRDIDERLTSRRLGLCPRHSVHRHSSYQSHMGGPGVRQGLPTSSSVEDGLMSLEDDSLQQQIGWAESDDASILPNSEIVLQELGPIVYRLLHGHQGRFHVASMLDCYVATSGDVQLTGLRLNADAVCLEHLVGCLPDVTILQQDQDKMVVWSRDAPEQEPVSVNPMLQQRVQALSREVVDLLRVSPRARMPFTRFIPAYHHHFGRQCRVSEYGFTRLSDLLEVIPHVVETLGSGQRRLITLTERAQMRRFLSDLMRVLKCQQFKQLPVAALPTVFGDVIGRPFCVWDYGVTLISQLLEAVCGDSVVMYKQNGESFVAIPRREQTSEEMQRTRHFAVEVQELMKQMPRCRIQFNKFIPAYHHHFGRQCRVADFGFTKLAEVFEAVAETVLLTTDEDGEKLVQLTADALKSVLSQQIVELLQDSPGSRLPLNAISAAFLRRFGYHLEPRDYASPTLPHLVGTLRRSVRLTDGVVLLVDQHTVRKSSARIRLILIESAEGCLPVDEFTALYTARFGTPPDMDIISDHMLHLVQLTSNGGGAKLRLLPLQLVARELVHVLRCHDNQLSLAALGAAYLGAAGAALRPARLGFHSTAALLEAMPETVLVLPPSHTKGGKRAVRLLREFAVGNDSAALPVSDSVSASDNHGLPASGVSNGGSTGFKASVFRWPGAHVAPPHFPQGWNGCSPCKSTIPSAQVNPHTAAKSEQNSPRPPPPTRLPSPRVSWLPPSFPLRSGGGEQGPSSHTDERRPSPTKSSARSRLAAQFPPRFGNTSDDDEQ